jgi:RNA binding exosome subunit
VSSSVIHVTNYDSELNEKVRIIVENFLQEKINVKGERSNGHVENKIEHLENKLKQMEIKIAEQDKTIAFLKSVITNIEPVNDKMLGTFLNSSNENKHISSKIDEAEDMDVGKMIAPGRRVKRAVANIAFSAYLTQTNSHTIVGQPIKFDQVLLNDGQGYNKYTGAFTAPLSGVYLFTYAIDTRKLTFVRLVINGVNQVDAVANVHTNAESRHSQSMGGNTAIVHVGHGQSVLVETYEIPDAETASSNTFRLCTFSGVLLY